MAADTPAATERIFFALWPDARTARRLHSLGREIDQGRGARVMRAETLHVTLAFLGDIPLSRIAQLKRLAAKVEFSAFDLRLDFVDRWAHNRIVWLGSSEQSHDLSKLAADLQNVLEKAGFKLEKRSFQPHLTLLRKANYPVCRMPIETQHWRAEAFSLVASRRTADGARYKILSRWPARCVSDGS